MFNLVLLLILFVIDVLLIIFGIYQIKNKSKKLFGYCSVVLGVLLGLFIAWIVYTAIPAFMHGYKIGFYEGKAQRLFAAAKTEKNIQKANAAEIYFKKAVDEALNFKPNSNFKMEEIQKIQQSIQDTKLLQQIITATSAPKIPYCIGRTLPITHNEDKVIQIVVRLFAAHDSLQIGNNCLLKWQDRGIIKFSVAWKPSAPSSLPGSTFICYTNNNQTCCSPLGYPTETICSDNPLL